MPPKKARAAAASSSTPRQAPRKKASFLDAFAKTGARQAHPHLAPLNRATWADDREVVLQKADRLVALAPGDGHEDVVCFRADRGTAGARRTPDSLFVPLDGRDDLLVLIGCRFFQREQGLDSCAGNHHRLIDAAHIIDV